jgi:hypothetical protein
LRHILRKRATNSIQQTLEHIATISCPLSPTVQSSLLLLEQGFRRQRWRTLSDKWMDDW